MESNADKCHLLVSTGSNVNIRIDNFDISNSNIDHKIAFDDHISGLRKNASKEVHALARVKPCMNISKRPILMNTFVASQFSYCPRI